MLVITLVAILVVVFYYLLKKHYRYWKDHGVKQTDSVLLLGDTWGPLFRVYSFAQMLENAYTRHPDTRYTGLYHFTVPILLLKDPELIKQMIVKDFEYFPDHVTIIPEDVDPLWGKNLLTLKGQKWRHMRATMSPLFTGSKMRMMFGLMQECAKNFVQHFQKKDGDILTVQIKDVFSRFATDVVGTTVFGIEVNSVTEPNNEFYLLGKDITNFDSLWKNLKFVGYLMIPKLFKHLNVRLFEKEVGDFFRQIIDSTIKIREEKGIVRPDMINLLMEARKRTENREENEVTDKEFATAEDINKGKVHVDLTNEDITAQAIGFFFAGFESISNFMSFTAYELAVNQDVQQKLREEIDTNIREFKGTLSYETLMKMRYMDMVLSESLRKWPMAFATDRVCSKPYTIEPVNPGEQPVRLEKGALVWIPIFAIHYNADYYPNPERFDPERFSEENKEKIKPGTYFPFGLGPRNCLGSRFALMEAQIVFFYILSCFEIIPVDKTKIPVRLSKKAFNLIADGGIWLGLKRRVK